MRLTEAQPNGVPPIPRGKWYGVAIAPESECDLVRVKNVLVRAGVWVPLHLTGDEKVERVRTSDLLSSCALVLAECPSELATNPARRYHSAGSYVVMDTVIGDALVFPFAGFRAGTLTMFVDNFNANTFTYRLLSRTAAPGYAGSYTEKILKATTAVPEVSDEGHVGVHIGGDDSFEQCDQIVLQAARGGEGVDGVELSVVFDAFGEHGL